MLLEKEGVSTLAPPVLKSYIQFYTQRLYTWEINLVLLIRVLSKSFHKPDRAGGPVATCFLGDVVVAMDVVVASHLNPQNSYGIQLQYKD